MLFKTSFISAIALLAANQVIGAAVELPRGEAGILIATDPCPFSPLVDSRNKKTHNANTSLADCACNCPNNCSYKPGTGCRFYSGPSDNSKVLKGKCQNKNGKLTCIPT
ncbi:hypothetical protein V490_08470 [Pseudogymnoascus sp. VKM F-3557]|nr:hypothetical protein V490_08470 [Pseudogymnoascus sp. VKM F-3557]